MTNKPKSGTVSVSRELRSLLAMVLNALDRDAEDGKAVRGEMASELRALLAQPADQPGEPVALPEVLPLSDARCPQHRLIADGFRSGADWMRREVAKLGPLYRHAQPATAKLDERAEFEAWECHSDQGPQTDPIWMDYSSASNSYGILSVQANWIVWQARAKLNGGQS